MRNRQEKHQHDSSATHRQTRAPGPRPWAGYAAAAWALAFAGPHLYCGVGGSVGLDSALNREIVEHRSGSFVALNWGIGLFCVAGGLVALATVRPWGHRVPAWLLRGLAWLGFVLLAARALDIYVEFGLGLTGITPISVDQRDEYLRLARRFLFLWLPWFTLGAVAWGALASQVPRPMPPRWDAQPPGRPPHRQGQAQQHQRPPAPRVRTCGSTAARSWPARATARW